MPSAAAAKPEAAWLGAELKTLSEQSVKALGLSQAHAVLVVLSVPGGPAARAGLRPGDVIVELDSAPVGGEEDLVAAIQRLGAGKAVALGILRGNERMAIPVALGRLADNQSPADPDDLWERRIAAYTSVVELLDPKTFAADWAAVRSDLGDAYRNRPRGDRADNLEKAIAAYGAALTVRTREALPRDWADTQNKLGIAYWSRIRGDRADNLENAIAAYEAALTVRTRETLPEDWGDTQNNLGVAYADRIRGERADNLERAIAAYQAAFAVRTREAQPRDWADTQNNLGIAYADRIRGERTDNLEKAIAAYQASLTVRTREALPEDWAATQNNLGIIYHYRIGGDRADNLEKAIAAYQATLTVTTREALPYHWAATLLNLGTAYWSRILGNRSDNLEEAIAAYQATLSVYTREALPREWARTQTNLGVAYQDRILGGRVDNLEKAIAAYEAALSVRTRVVSPREHLATARLLGRALSGVRRWPEAGSAFAGAREAFTVLFGQGLNEAEAQDLIEEAGPLFAEAAFAAAQLADSEKALALASEGRARLMAVALKLQTLDLPTDKRRRLDALRAEFRLQERAAEATQGSERAAALEKLVGHRQELLGLVKDADAAAATGHASALVQARALAGRNGAVIVPIVTRLGTKVLIVRPGSERAGVAPIDLPELSTDRLNTLIRGGDKTGGWLGVYTINNIRNDKELQQRWPEWLAAIDGLGPELWRLLGMRLDEVLKKAGVAKGARVVWLPTDALGILPLGLAQDPASKRRLGDDYEIVYAPSLDALASAQGRIARPVPATLAAVINPTGDLIAAGQEGRLVASRFPTRARAVLEGPAATPNAVLAALKGHSYWHFASHGTFSWADARKSGLYMAGPEVLSVGRLLETEGLGRPRLVVLSRSDPAFGALYERLGAIVSEEVRARAAP